MKKNLTFLFLMFAAFLFLGNDLVTAQTLDSAWTATPSWNASSTYRGFAYGNERIYSAGRGGWPSAGIVQVVNSMTGADVKTLDGTGITDLTFDLVDAEVSDDGSILAAPLTVDASSETGWGKGFYTIYRWEDESSSPQPFVVYKGVGRCDMFSVVGDVTDDAVIMGGVSSANKVWRYIITDGVISAVEEIPVDGSLTAGTVTVACPAGLTASDGFWYSNAVTHPTLCDNTGAVVGTIPASVFEGVTGQMKLFTFDSKDYLLVADGGKAKLINITGKAPADITSADVVYTSHGVPGTTNLQDVDYRIGPDGSLSVFSFAADNGIFAASTEAAPVATDLMFDGIPVVGGTLTAMYTYSDINRDAEGTSEIKWYISDDENGLNKAEITASAGSMTYDVVAGDVGKYISFTILPVASTGTVSDAGNLVESSLYGAVVAETTAPVASDAALSGIVQVGEKLTATYTYTDAEGDAEGSSIYEWYRLTDTDTTKVASGSLEYTPVSDDAEQNIMFVVIPVAAEGFLFEGTPDSVVTATTVLFPPLPPEAKDLAINGREDVAAVLTGTYTYEDLNGDAEEGSILKWYRATDADTVEVATDTNMYTLVAADEDGVIFFEVTAVSVPTEGIDTGTAVMVKTDTINPEPPDYAPEARNVVLSGTPEVGALLSATYDYFDTILNDPEGASIYKWYASDDSAGTGSTLIEGADGQTYLVPESQLGKHFTFEVTPVATSGGLLEGTPVKSNGTSTAAVASDNTFGLERLWLGSSKKGAVPHYLYESDYLERGIAVGSDKIYIASRNGGVRVMMIDKADGSYIGDLNTEGISGGIYAINDVEVSDDGQILAAPLAVGTEFWIYKWADELSAPEKWIEITLTESMRLGDKFSVTGDVSGDAIIMAAKSEGNKIVRWVVTGGIVAPADTVMLSGVTSIGNSPNAVPFTGSADANILVDGKGFAPTVFDKDGNNLGGISGIEEYAKDKTQSNSPNVFMYKGRTMAAFYQHMRKDPFGVRTVVVDITAPPYQLIDSTEYLSDMGGTYDYLGEVDVTTDGDYYYTYQMQGKNALGAYRGELELPEFVSAETNHAGDMIYTVIDKALMEITKTDAGPWKIMDGTTEMVIDSIRSSNDSIIFKLAAAVTEGGAVTIEYDGLGTIAAFNGMPLAAFGPESVSNVSGADVPVATDVAITGTLELNEVLTGTYTFTDPDGDAEGTSTFQWWEATKADGSDKLKILGEKALTYTVGADMGNKYVAFQVTPVSATGGEDYLIGEPVMSAFERIIVVGISDEFATGVRMYPNPVRNTLTIQNVADVQSITLVDIAGRIMMTVENNGANEVILSMVDLRNGVYFVKLTGENNQLKIDKVLKTK